MPFIMVHIIVLAVGVKILGIIPTYCVDSIHITVVNRRKVRPGIVQQGPVLQTLLLFDVLEHPVAAHIVLVSSSDAEESPMISDDCSTEFRNVLVEVNQILGLLPIDHIVEMDILVAPLEVMDDPSIRQLLLHNEELLEEIDNMLFDIDMIIFSDHRLLISQIVLKILN